MYLITIAITFLPLFLVEENIIKPRDKKRVIKYLYFFSALFLVLLACLRDNTLGNDVRNYMSVYFVNSRTHELGFWVLIDIVRFFIRDFQVFISINSILSLVPTSTILNLSSSLLLKSIKESSPFLGLQL